MLQQQHTYGYILNGVYCVIDLSVLEFSLCLYNRLTAKQLFNCFPCIFVANCDSVDYLVSLYWHFLLVH